jgi:hypothetical protein
VTVDERFKKTFLFVTGVDVPVGESTITLPGVVGRDALIGVDGFVVDEAAPIN